MLDMQASGYVTLHCIHWACPTLFITTSRRSDLAGFHMCSLENSTLVKYRMPTRGLLGLRNILLTASRGTAILNTQFHGFGEWAGDISTREQGSLVRSLSLKSLHSKVLPECRKLHRVATSHFLIFFYDAGGLWNWISNFLRSVQLSRKRTVVLGPGCWGLQGTNYWCSPTSRRFGFECLQAKSCNKRPIQQGSNR